MDTYAQMWIHMITHVGPRASWWPGRQFLGRAWLLGPHVYEYVSICMHMCPYVSICVHIMSPMSSVQRVQHLRTTTYF